MRHLLQYRALISIGVLASGLGCRTQPAPTLEGHALGESIASFISESADLKRILTSCKDSLSAECNVANQLTSATYSGILHCSGQTESLDACRNNRGEFIFNDGRLTAIEFIEPNTWTLALGTLSARFGKPTETDKGSGKTAGAISAIWSASTYRLSLAGFENDPSDQPTVCVILQTLDHYAKASQQQEESQTGHDEILASYRETVDNHKKDEAALAEDQNRHANPALISADKMLVVTEESSLKMDEILLKNEVREDESSDAIY